MSTENNLKENKEQCALYGVMHRYFFISWNKHWKGIYIHLPKTTHRFYIDSKYKPQHDKYSNVGAKISQALGV